MGFALPGLFGSARLEITDDGEGVAPALAARLARHGIAAQVITESSGHATAVVHLAGLRRVRDEHDAASVLKSAFQSARSVARQCTKAGQTGLFVTVQDTGGDFGFSGHVHPTWAALGALAGLVKTAAREWPHASVKAIDLERAARSATALAHTLANELLYGGGEVEVGLRASGERVTVQSFPQPLASTVSVTPFVDTAAGRSDAVWVVSGGARGVTAASIVELARATRARFILLGRSDIKTVPLRYAVIDDEAELRRILVSDAKARGEHVLPAAVAREARDILASRNIAATLAALRDAGAPARYCQVDVRNTTALEAVLAEARREWGPITGMVHGAGIRADRLIADKTDEQFEQVLHTKVYGAYALLAATATDPLTHIVMFSSITARCGNSGQSDYAMANEALNKLAVAEYHRRGGHCRVKSLNWGPWEGGMVTPALRPYLERAGVPLIPLQDGARMFVDEVLRGSAQEIEVVLDSDPRQGYFSTVQPPARTATYDVVVDAASWPFLSDHRVREQPVLPMVLVLEWFTRMARALRPARAYSICEDLRVLCSVELQAFDTGAATRFCIHGVVAEDDGSIHFRLTSPDGVPHYTARFVLDTPPSTPGSPLYEPLQTAGPVDNNVSLDIGHIYPGMLFHGPAFRVLRSFSSHAQHCVASVASTPAMGWGAGPWLVDPAALDGGLQLALLWNRTRHGRSSLPMRIGTCMFDAAWCKDTPLQCVLSEKRSDTYGSTFALRWHAPDGACVAAADEVETYFIDRNR